MNKSKMDVIEHVLSLNVDKSNGEIADILINDYTELFQNWKRKSVRDEVRKMRIKLKGGKRFIAPGEKESYDFRQGGNTAVFSRNFRGEQITNIDELIKVCNIDTKLWKVDRWICNKWEMASKSRDQDLKWIIDEDGDGNKQQLMEGHATRKNEFLLQELWQVKAWLIRNVDEIVGKSIKEEILKEIKKHSVKYPKIKYPKIIGSKSLFQVNIFDLHFGKHSWEDETGENFDIKLATEEYINCLMNLVGYSKPYSIGKILLPVGNDFFNVDNRFNTTSNGTPQSEDTRWQKTFQRGRQLIIKGIDMLSQIAPVDIVVIPGNHDMERSYYLGEVLDSWYHNNPNVDVNNGPKVRKYYRFGKVLLGLTHGRDEKIIDLPLTMANEAPDLWAKTKYREWHLGHIHHKKEIKWVTTQEYKGVTVRFMRSLTPPDAWHYQKGYVANVRAGEGFIWDENNGLVSQFSSNL